MLTKRSLFALVVSVALLLLPAGTVFATVFTGTLTWDAAGTQLVAADKWAGTGTSITYVVDDTTSPGYWHYKYILTVHSSVGAGISHLNIETTPDFTAEKLLNSTWGGDTEVGLLLALHGMPDGMYGIKFDELPDNGATFTVEFDSLRYPIWGDFFAKGGPSSYVHNAGFTSPDSDPDPLDPWLNPNVTDHILVPNLHEIPEPATLALLGLGGTVLLARRKK